MNSVTILSPVKHGKHILEIVLIDSGISFSFAAHWLSQITSHISTAAGRIKFSEIVSDDLVRVTLNVTKYDAFNNFSFDRKGFIKPSFYLKFSFKKKLLKIQGHQMSFHFGWFDSII